MARQGFSSTIRARFRSRASLWHGQISARCSGLACAREHLDGTARFLLDDPGSLAHESISMARPGFSSMIRARLRARASRLYAEVHARRSGLAFAREHLDGRARFMLDNPGSLPLKSISMACSTIRARLRTRASRWHGQVPARRSGLACAREHLDGRASFMLNDPSSLAHEFISMARPGSCSTIRARWRTRAPQWHVQFSARRSELACAREHLDGRARVMPDEPASLSLDIITFAQGKCCSYNASGRTKRWC
jgi:hypothetical protein